MININNQEGEKQAQRRCFQDQRREVQSNLRTLWMSCQSWMFQRWRAVMMGVWVFLELYFWVWCWQCWYSYCSFRLSLSIFYQLRRYCSARLQYFLSPSLPDANISSSLSLPSLAYTVYFSSTPPSIPHPFAILSSFSSEHHSSSSLLPLSDPILMVLPKLLLFSCFFLSITIIFQCQIKKYTITTAKASINHTKFFFIQYCQTNFFVPSSKRLDSSLIFLAFSEVSVKDSCLPSSKLMFSFIISWIFQSSFFIRSTFLTELGSSYSFFFSLIFRSNLMKQSSVVKDSSFDQQCAAVNCVLTSSKNSGMMAQIKAPASLTGYDFSTMIVKITQLCTLQKTPN